MTFRTKLLQGILAVVAASTVASLFVAQRQSSESYDGLVDELFRSQATAFAREHEMRLDVAAGEIERLAMSVRLFAALEENDPEVYKVAGDELRLGEFAFFRLLDMQGNVIPPPTDGRAGEFDLSDVRGALVPPGHAAHGAAKVQVGFIEMTRGEQPSIAYRIMSTPISNFETTVGTLIVGQRIRRLGTEADQPNEGLHAALWIDGRLVGGDVPDALHDPLAVALDASPLDASKSAELTAGGKNYRYDRFRLNEGSPYPPVDLVSVFPTDGFEAQQRNLAIRIAGTGAVALVIAALVGLALSRQLAQPIAGLVAATRQIRQGDYRLALAPSSTEEIATLAASFNEMAAGLELKDRYHAVLHQVADPTVADELIAGRIKLGGELRDMTVMFCDIRDYTPMTVGRAPEEVIEILNHHMGAMTRIVQAHKGVINQFAGDAIMALFGAPRSYGDDAQRAVRCARAMMLERERMNVDAVQTLRIGVGIASGAMVAGCIGEESRSDYTVVGERVVLGARIAAAAAPGQILIDDETRIRIGVAYATKALAPLQLKGFAEPVVAFAVVSEGAAA
jgi:class 3 adenylate cyclase